MSIPIGTFAPVYSTNPAQVENIVKTYPVSALEVRGVNDTSLGASGGYLTYSSSAGLDASGLSKVVGGNSTSSAQSAYNVYPSNLIADMESIPSTSINQLRLAFATQALLKKMRVVVRVTEKLLSSLCDKFSGCSSAGSGAFVI